MDVNTTFILACIGILSLLCQWLAWRIRVPAILFLLGAGVLAGPVTGVLVPEAVFGELLFPLISLSVAIILFEGSLTLRFDEIKGHGNMVRNLIPVGTLVTFLIATVAARFALDLAWPIALLFGAIVVVTGPTVIVPLLRSVRPTSKLANILRWEGIVIDPVGALLAVLIFEGILSSGQGNLLGHSLYLFFTAVGTGTVLGCLGGYLMGLALRKHLLPQYLHNAATLTFMLGLFALSNNFAHESGLLTVTVMGIWMANMKNVPIDDIVEFKESLSVLLISALFIILAARVEFGAIAALGSGLVWVLFAVILVARPLTVWLSAIGTGLTLREKLFLSWISPRGIVAAAVSALFAFKLQERGYEDAGVLVPLVFMVIITTVTIQSLSARPLARALRVAQPAAYGYLIMGANPVARQIAKALQNRDVPVTLTDTNYENIRQARMDNLPVYFGNPVSEHARNHLDLTGIGNVLVISPYKQMNSLVSYHFLDWFGLGHVYTLYEGDQEQNARHRTAEKIQQTRGLFGGGVTYSKLASMASKGFTVKATQLTGAFSLEQYQRLYDGKAVILFTIDPKGRIQPVTEQRSLKLDTDWELIGLVPQLDKDRARTSREQQETRAKSSASQAHSGPQDAWSTNDAQPDPASWRSPSIFDYPQEPTRTLMAKDPDTERLNQFLDGAGLPPARHSVPVAGGDIGHCTQVTLEGDRRVFIKRASNAPADFFTAEAVGLEALRALAPAQLLRIPEVLHASPAGLILEWLEPGSRAGNYWDRFGAGLAAIHRTHQPYFGFERDNYCGLTPQPNTHFSDGYHFFAAARLQHQARLARDCGRLGMAECRKLDRLCERLERWIPKQPPVLIHGDLWSGNAHVGPEGEPVLIDPAVYYGWAEADLAMTTLFGRFHPRFYASYLENGVVAPDWETRADLYNLYHQLNHLNLFGGGYLGGVQQVLNHRA